MSYIIVVFSIIVYFFSRESSAAQYLTFSYNMVFHLLFLIYNRPNRKILIHYGIVILGLFSFILGGSRGAFIALVATVVLIFTLNESATLRKIIIGVMSIITLMIITFYKSVILSRLGMILNNLGIESRTFERIIDHSFLDDSVRMVIYEALANKIEMFGYGLMGDRVILNGSYAHNLFLEWLIDFGFIGGSIIIFLFVVIVFRGILCSAEFERLLILILLPNGFFQLMMSGSYLNQAPALFVLLGFCMNANLRRKKVESINNQ